MATPTRGTSSRRRWPSTSAAATTAHARAYEWLTARQRPDGSWHAYYLGDDVEDETLDTNVTCYVATGAWHHYLSTDDLPFLRRQWPAIEAAIDFALEFQRETGEIAWRGDDPDDGALLTGCSSIHLSLKCAIAIGELLGHERPDWELSLGSLATRDRAPPRRVPRQAAAGRWTGTTPSWAACCAASPRTLASSRAPSASSSTVAASAACPIVRGSPRPRRVSS